MSMATAFYSPCPLMSTASTASTALARGGRQGGRQGGRRSIRAVADETSTTKGLKTRGEDTAGGRRLGPHAQEVPAALKNHRVAVLSASKSAVYPIVELERPVGMYMTLPASQYSVLDAQRVERIDADTFRCYVGGINFLSFRVEPVLTLSVIVGERGPTVRLLETTLEGSKAAVEANSKFTATMTNKVAWRELEEGGEEAGGGDGVGGISGIGGVGGEGMSVAIASDTTLTVTLQVPRWFVVPVSVVESSGSAIMQKILDVSVPKFLAQLQTDYAKWSAGEVRDTMDEDLE